MEFRVQLVKNLLRILTPEEIAELTTSSSERKKVSLSILMESDLSGENYIDVMESHQDGDEDKDKSGLEEAKILAFEEDSPEEETPFVFQVGQRVHSLLEEYGKVFAELDKKVLGPKRFPKKKGYSGKKQTSELILEQKKKLHDSYSKIKSQEVLSLYQETNATEIQKRSNDDDFSYSSKLGVLINKKQA